MTSRANRWRVYGMAVAVIAAAVLAGSALGPDGVGFGAREVLVALRLPRVLLGAIVGGALACAGVASQALLRNPLADPYVLGVSGGAALGGVLASVLWRPVPTFVLIIAATIGALGSVLTVFVPRRVRFLSVDALLLSGVVFNAFAAALITLVKAISTPAEMQALLFWLMGELQVYDYSYIAGLALIVGGAVLLLIRSAPELDLLAQGEDTAATLGVEPKQVRRRVYLAITCLVGAVVAMSGLIGFIGLVVPHLVRERVGARHGPLLVLSGAVGCALLVVADALCRLGFRYLDTELPVGVLTAFIGAPYFLWVLKKRR